MTRWLEGWRTIVVNDAYKLLPTADVLYAADNSWWEIHGECKPFAGEKWACHERDPNPREIHGNDKRSLAERYGINLVRGRDCNEFSFDPDVVHYGHNSGFQAINFALLMGCRQIVLIGFDMRLVNGQAHFFGNHPREIRTPDDKCLSSFIPRFAQAAKKLPKDVSIVNATPGSALTCFPIMSFDEAVRRQDHCVYRDRAESHAAAG
jgi:hypothetical protein